MSFTFIKSAILVFFLIATLLPGVLFPGDVEARMERHIAMAEGDPIDGYESSDGGGGGGGDIIIIPGDQIQMDKDDEIFYLGTFENPFFLSTFLPLFDGNTLVWKISCSCFPPQGGKN